MLVGGTSLVLCGVVATVYLAYKVYQRRDLNHIPGPPAYPIVGNALQLTKGHFRQDFKRWAAQYGGLFKVQLLLRRVVVVSKHELIYEALVKKGFDFAGRPSYFRMDYLLERTGLNNTEPDALWRTLRRLSQRYLRQFGEGMGRLEEIIHRVSLELFDKFEAASEEGVDPRELISEATLKTISVLVVGEVLQPGTELYENIRTFEREIFKGVSHTSVDYMMLDIFPFLIHVPFLRSSQAMKRVTRVKGDVWREIRRIVRQNPDRECFAKMMIDTVAGDGVLSDKDDVRITEKDARMNCMILLNAGHATTTMTFYALLNILAHRPWIQEKMVQDIAAVVGETGPVTLAHKSRLHYVNATILELFRYFTTLPIGVARRTMVDTALGGVPIPKNTWIFNNFWAMHHDEDFWKDPENFRPERFLENDPYELVAADHPNRKHVMNFSAGPRVCLGEQLARTRIFLWAANVVRRFRIVPDAGNTASMTDSKAFYEELILRPPPYKVMFKPRAQ